MKDVLERCIHFHFYQNKKNTKKTVFVLKSNGGPTGFCVEPIKKKLVGEMAQ